MTAQDDTTQRIITSMDEDKQRIPYDLIKSGLKLELISYSHRDGMLYVHDSVYVSDNEVLRPCVVAVHHESLSGGHSGRQATYEELAGHYYWPHMTATVVRFVRKCLTGQHSKPHQEGKHRLLHALPIPDTCWNSISVDFITPLPPCAY